MNLYIQKISLKESTLFWEYETIILENSAKEHIGKMRIAIFHELPMGGARKVVNSFSKELIKRNIVDLYIVDAVKRVDEDNYYSKTNFYKFIPKKWEGGDWKIKLYKDTLELWKLYKLHKKIAQKINRGNYDIVVVHPSRFTQAPFILRFISLKSIYYAHESYRIMYESYFKYNYSENAIKNIYEILTRFTKKIIDRINLKRANFILTNSSKTKKDIRKYYSTKSTVCYPGVDTDFFSPSNVKKDIDVLFVGSTDDNTDGFYDLKEAISNIRQITYRAIGDGKLWLTDKEFRNFYRRSKIVFCGAHNEPLGLVPLEAGSCAVPVIAIEEGGYKETVIDGKTGYFVERKEKDIKKVIKKLLRKNSAINKLSKFARKNAVNNWSINKLGKNFEKVLTNIVMKNVQY